MVRCDLRSRSLVSGAILAAVFGLASAPARADVNLLDEGGLKIDGAFTGGISALYSPGAQFGAGTFATDGRNGLSPHRISGHPAWTELFLHPELKAAYESATAGTYYADVSGQLTATGGDGDASAISTTYGHPALLDVENAYGGWRSGKLLTDIGLDEDAVDVSGGRQSFRVADGFLISSGTWNGGQRGGWWNQSRTAFAQTGLLKLATGPVRADVFYLENDSSQHKFTSALDMAKTQVIGGNIELFANADKVEGGPDRNGATTYADRKWYVGTSFFHVLEAKKSGVFSFGSNEVRTGATSNNTVTNTISSNRDGMNVFDVHFGGNPIDAVPDFSLYGNYVYESNDSANEKVKANAWYIEPGYQFSEVPWTPKLSYRYVHFSGDKTPGDTTKKAYDPYFYNSVTRGFGTWFLGEIVGNYVISNSNVNVNQLVFSINPRDDLKLSVLAYTYNFDQKAQYQNVTSDDLAREIDFTAEWAINDNLSLSAAFAAARAGSGGRSYLRNQVGINGGEQSSGGSSTAFDSVWYMGETALVVKF